MAGTHDKRGDPFYFSAPQIRAIFLLAFSFMRCSCSSSASFLSYGFLGLRVVPFDSSSSVPSRVSGA
eukprot:scaffold150455_cov30-Tisochrysis_lutea.AAC.3